MDDHTGRRTSWRVLIADDERPSRNEIRRLIAESDDFIVTAEAENGNQAFEQALALRPDVIFLDIQMPGSDGIETAQKFLKHQYHPLIVFITAFEEYAVKAFELHAVDYLLKPFGRERFSTMLERIRDRLSRENSDSLQEQQLTEIIRSFSEKQRVNRIAVYRGDRIVPVRISDILFVEAKGRSCSIYTKDMEFQSSYMLYELEQMLRLPDFFHCHRSFIINLNAIESIEIWVNSTYRVILEGREEQIPVSRAHTAEFKELMSLI